jgi:hypothetical protein
VSDLALLEPFFQDYDDGKEKVPDCASCDMEEDACAECTPVSDAAGETS